MIQLFMLKSYLISSLHNLQQHKSLGSSASLANSQVSKESILHSDDDYSDDDGSGNGRPVKIKTNN